MSRLTITLNQNEREAIYKLAERECREPRAQAALIIRNELERMGLLPFETPAKEATRAAQSEPAQGRGANHASL